MLSIDLCSSNPQVHFNAIQYNRHRQYIYIDMAKELINYQPNIKQ